MDPTTQAFLAALIGAVVAGGAVLAWAISDRQHSFVPEPEEPAVPPAVATVLSVLRSSAVVVGDDDTVLKASAPAYAFGLVRGNVLVAEELTELVRQVRRDGQIRETELLLSRTDMPSRHVTARVAPMGSRLVLALIEDRTRERRVEAVRRDFVANVSHELKTPIGAIRLLAEAILDAADDPEAVKRFGGRMLTESDRLTRLVQQIIELSRLQGDDPLEAPVPVSVDHVIAAAVDASAIDADTRRISLVTGGTHGPRGLRERRAGRGRGGQPGGQRRRLLRRGLHGAGLGEDERRARSRSRSSTRASGSRPARWTGSSSASTASTRRGTARPAGPASASRSSSTSRPPTAATSACGRSRDRAPRSP